MLQVIVRDVPPNGDTSRARIVGQLDIRDDQTGTSVLGKMSIWRRGPTGEERYTVVDHDIRTRDLWSMIARVARPPRGGRGARVVA